MQITRSFAVLQLVAALALSACSTTRQSQESKAVAAGSGSVFEEGRDPFGSEAAASMANGDMVPDGGSMCSNFSLTIVGPFVQVVGEEAMFWGHAEDDQRHEFELSWSASAGELSEKRGKSTKHTCSEPGISTISMTASLATVCSSAIAHVVTCLMPVE